MARQGGLEPPTRCLEGSCSILLSYWRVDDSSFPTITQSLIFFNPSSEREIGESGFEPPTSCSQGRRANQAAPLPEKNNPLLEVGLLKQVHTSSTIGGLDKTNLSRIANHYITFFVKK